MAKVALLIGVSEYEPGLNPLLAAVKDVEALQQVLLHPEMGGFDQTDIMVLKNPLRQDMEEEIENLFAHRQKDDLLLLFFSGHGINSKPKSFLEALPSKHFSQSQGYHKTTFYSAFQTIPLATFKRSL